MIKLEWSDFLQLKLLLEKKFISSANVLHMLKTSNLVPANLAVLQRSDIQTFVSQFLDENGAEGKLAAEIISPPIHKKSIELPEETLSKLLKDLIPLLSTCNQTTKVSNLRSCIDKVCIKLLSLKKVLETDVMQLLQSIPDAMLDKAVKEMCLYVKLHLLGKL